MSGRKPIPNAVKKILRTEVGFGCPVKGCGNPYLEYHHFDPPVSVRPHNNPEGMIALCAQHHKKADGGAYTVEQLHALKSDKANADLVKGNLDWLRKDLLAVVGGNFYYETPKIITIDNIDLVSLVRDDDGYLRLNINMLSLEPEERIIIEDNSWENIGSPIDLRSPPQGKELEVSYPNGDYLYLRFIELKSKEQAVKRYSYDVFDDLAFPLTAVEVNMTIAGTKIELTPQSSQIGGLQITGCLSSYCGGGVLIQNSGLHWSQNPIWKRQTLVEETEHPNVLKVNFGRR
ncbi:TPA: HNH endonuclease [Photobacterium damselae]|uniref:HNH endonuclease n=1 Tax=Photobacterium damselae TaxID=38293 RepID=UPI0010FEDE39|nr:HNH endonuclease [Photobacterium damselae]TLS83789.1 HNH endonuclease [Photobacterium damselae subsp. damselae]TLS90981.1 HNH endonuclease [Photobacterium damselae subsp. damselae]